MKQETSPIAPRPDRRLQAGFQVLLFDIDGTLLRASRRLEYREMMCSMLAGVFGTEGKLRQVDFSGRTDMSIYREALEGTGIDPAAIRSRLSEIEQASVDIVRRMSASGAAFYLCRGVKELLETLSRDGRFALTLLTGNLEALAHAKVHSAGIGHFFRLRGAYGSDAEDRNQLPAIAARRVGDQLGELIPPGRMIIIGDTPRDIECARHFGIRVVAVASGFHTLDQLRPFGPDALLPDFGRTREVVRLLSGLRLKRGR